MNVQNQSPSKVTKSKKRGRPLLHSGVDRIIQTLIRSTGANSGVFNTAVANAIKDALVKKYLSKSLAMCNFQFVLWLEVCSIMWDL